MDRPLHGNTQSPTCTCIWSLLPVHTVNSSPFVTKTTAARRRNEKQQKSAWDTPRRSPWSHARRGREVVTQTIQMRQRACYTNNRDKNTRFENERERVRAVFKVSVLTRRLRQKSCKTCSNTRRWKDAIWEWRMPCLDIIMRDEGNTLVHSETRSTAHMTATNSFNKNSPFTCSDMMWLWTISCKSAFCAEG